MTRKEYIGNSLIMITHFCLGFASFIMLIIGPNLFSAIACPFNLMAGAAYYYKLLDFFDKREKTCP